ncbi:MAG: hypothetical protein OHK0052_21180 [Anaerolineales bacterium]
MAEKKLHLHDGRRGSALTIRVTPRASRNEVVDVLNDGTIRVRLKSSAQDDEINRDLLTFMAHVLGVEIKNMEIVAGTSGRDKLVAILDIDVETVQQRILRSLP